MAQQYGQTTEPGTERSQPAPQPEPKPGPGVQAVEGLLRAGMPEPEKIVEILDAHRGERDAIFALLHQTAGNAYVQRVMAATAKLRASIDRREVVAGDPGAATGGFFEASQARGGAAWRTGDGRFTGTADKKGLDSRYQLDDDDALHARVGTDRTGSLAWERDGKTAAELYGSYKSGSDYEVGARRPWEVGGGTLTTGLRHRVTAGGTTDGLVGSYKTGDGRTTVDGALGLQDGGFAGSAGVSHALTPHDTITGAIAHDPTGTSLSATGEHRFDGGSVSGSASLHHGAGGTTGSIGAAYRDRTTQLDGSLSHGLESDKLHLGGSHQLAPELTLGGHLDHERKRDGRDQTTFGLSERYRTGDLVHGLSLEAGKGERDFLGVTGSMDARLAPSLYGGAFGSFQVEQGKQTTAQLGASLTFTPHEKAALTLAGVLDQDGVLETRLQLDVFKKKISGVGDIADHKKDALVSLFVSYSQQAGRPSMLDSRYGAGQLETGRPSGDGQFMAGIRIKF